MGDDAKICVGMIAGAHGVRGLVRLRSFTEDPETIADFHELSDEKGQRLFKVELKTVAKDHFIAAVEGVKSKEEADALRGVKLYVPRSVLPQTARGEYYEADLIGLTAKDGEGQKKGRVLAVHNYGAGIFLEIGEGKKSFMLPFNHECVPKVDMKAGEVVVNIPQGWL